MLIFFLHTYFHQRYGIKITVMMMLTKIKFLKPKFDPKISAKFTKRIKARTRNTHTDEYSF